MTTTTTTVPVYAQLLTMLRPRLAQLGLEVRECSSWMQIVLPQGRGQRIDLRKDVARVPLCDATFDTSLPTEPLSRPNGKVKHWVKLGDTTVAARNLLKLCEELVAAGPISKKETATEIPVIAGLEVEEAASL